MKINKKDYMNLIASLLNAVATDDSVYSIVSVYQQSKKHMPDTLCYLLTETTECHNVIKISKNDKGEEEKDALCYYYGVCDRDVLLETAINKKTLHFSAEELDPVKYPAIDPNISFEEAYRVVTDLFDEYPVLKNMLDELSTYGDKQINNDDIMDIIDKLTKKSYVRKKSND